MAECALRLKDLRGRFGLVEVPGSQWKQLSLVGAQFDEEGSYFQCGKQRANIGQSGHSFIVRDPVTFQMTATDPLTYAQEWSGVVPKSESVLWVEPGEAPDSIVVTTDDSRIPGAGLQALAVSTAESLTLKLQFHVVVRQGAGFHLPFLFGEGTQYWGATKGPVSLGGRQFSRLKGAKVVDGQLRQTH